MSTDVKTPSQPRPRHRRGAGRPLAAVAAVAVVGLIAAACGSSSPSASPTTKASPGGSPAATTTAPSSTGQTVAKSAANTTIGSPILVNAAGMTLYTFSADTSGMSNCTAACATNWPPLTVAAGVTAKRASGVTGTFGSLTRSDGTIQVTYNGQPLYTFVGDSTAGSASGENITVAGGKWTVVKTGSATSSPSATTKPSSPATTKPASGGGYGY